MSTSITVNGKELPIIDGKVACTFPVGEWTKIKISEVNGWATSDPKPTTVTWTIHPEGLVRQRPVVEGSVEDKR